MLAQNVSFFTRTEMENFSIIFFNLRRELSGSLCAAEDWGIAPHPEGLDVWS